MANSASLQLFELIASMSRSEKRYFKIYIRTHACKHEKDYIQLFSLVEGQEVYDEEKVVEVIEKKGASQRFAVLKHRLFEKILDSLESYKRSTDESLRLRHEINRAQVLLDRGLSHAGLAILCKVEQQALEIDSLETALAARALRIEQSEIHGTEISPDMEMDSILSQISDTQEVIKLRAILKDALRKSGRGSAELQGILQTTEEGLLPILNKKDLGPKARYIAHHTQATIEFSKSRIEMSLQQIKICQEILKTHTFLSDLMPNAKADMWANETYCHLRSKDTASARVSLRELLSIDEEDLFPYQRSNYRSDALQSLLFFLNHEADAEIEQYLVGRVEDFEKERWEHPPLIRAGIDYGLGLYYHSCGDPGRSLRCLSRVLNDGEVRRDEDIYHRTLVLITLLHAESGDREWMVHSARSLKRYLRPRNLLHGVAESLLTYISDLRRAKSPEGEHRALVRFRAELVALEQDEKQKLTFEHFNFLAWADSRLLSDDNPSLVA